MDWTALLGKAIDTAGTVVAAKVDKPLSNAVQTQPTNQLTPARENAEAAATAELGMKNTAPAMSKYLPYIIGGGVLIVGAFFLLAARSASK